jgi:hypothetical protein
MKDLLTDNRSFTSLTALNRTAPLSFSWLLSHAISQRRATSDVGLLFLVALRSVVFLPVIALGWSAAKRAAKKEVLPVPLQPMNPTSVGLSAMEALWFTSQWLSAPRRTQFLC